MSRTGRSDRLNRESARYPVRLYPKNCYVKKLVLNRLNRARIGTLAKLERFYWLAIFIFFWKIEVQYYFLIINVKLTTSLWWKMAKKYILVGQTKGYYISYSLKKSLKMINMKNYDIWILFIEVSRVKNFYSKQYVTSWILYNSFKNKKFKI